jgi:TonB-dependent heme/hemoglobin receptor
MRRNLLISSFLIGFGMSLDAPVGVAEETLPTLVVTATRVERELFDTPQAVTLVDSMEVEEYNVTSTPDLFDFATGVYIQKTNLGGGSPFIRGLTGKQVVILVDGVRLNNSYYRFGPHQYLNSIDPNIIERVEVVRGPTSVLYGSDALGGTINIITRRRSDFADTQDLDGLLYGLYDSAVSGGSVRLQAEGNIGVFGVLGGITRKNLDDLEAGGDIGEQVPSGYNETGADLKFNWQLSQQHEFILATQYLRQYDVPKTSEVTLGDKLKFNYEPQERQLAYFEYRGEDLDLFDLAKANLSYNRQKEGEEIIDGDMPTIETREVTDVRTLGATLQLTNALGDAQRITYGLEYYRDDYDTSKLEVDLDTGLETSVIPGTPDGAEYKSLGIYLQDEIRLGERADAVLGLRYSAFEADGTLVTETQTETLSLDTSKVTGSLNARYELSPTLNLVGGVAQGFRAPNMEDFFGRVDFTSEIPNTELEPEESVNWELGLKYRDSATTGEIFYYQADYEELIDRVEVEPGVEQRQNIGSAWIHGIEAGLSHDFDDHWSLSGTLSWTEGEDKETHQPLRRIPPMNGSFRARYNQNYRLWYELESLFARRQDRLSNGDIRDARIPEGGTPGYAIWSLKAGYNRTPGEQLLVTLENITDKEYKTHGSGLYAPGRSIILSYRLAID